jgi:uncharacterized protein (TIGR03086 family)
MLDLEPATSMVARLVEGIEDDQLSGPTPCRDTTVGALLDHVDGLSQAFAAAADKTALEGPGRAPSADASQLGPDWRARIPRRLAVLGTAWNEPSAWEGMTRAGPIDMPADVAGLVALDEVVVHGWDLAVATGQEIDCPPELAEALYGFVRNAVSQNPGGTPGMFGPPVAVPDDAPLFDRIIGLTGRDPAWRP